MFHDVNDSPVFAAAHNSYRPKQIPVCTHYGQTGHIVQKCFKIYGYPLGHRYSNSGNQSQRPSQYHNQNFYAPRR